MQIAGSTHFRQLALIALVAAVCSGLSACRDASTSFRSQFSASPNRVWIGPDYFANRLLDWRIQDGRLETKEGRQQKPMRTVHLLSRYLSSETGDLNMSVRTGSVDEVEQSDEHTWTGFLIGAGGEDTDFRISVLVHHWSERGGGLFVGVDGTGRIVVRDNEFSSGQSGPRGDYTSADWPVVESSSNGGYPTDLRDFRMRVRAIPDGSVYSLEVSTVESGTGKVIGYANYDDIPAHYLSGTVALVSHRSPSIVRNQEDPAGNDPADMPAEDGKGSGYWFSEWDVAGSKLVDAPERTFGPVLGTQYTLSSGILKLTAQFGPIGENDAQDATLELFSDRGWEAVDTASIHSNGYTASFRVEDWSRTGSVPYRVAYQMAENVDGPRDYYTGIIRSRPRVENELILGALNCQNVSGGDGSWTHDNIWYPHAETAEAVRWHNPDMLFFAGDQIYEGGISGIVRAPTDIAILDYLYHWYRFVWAFGDLMRDRPTVTIPDDHDVYHGNIWGEGGKAAVGDYSPASDNGGYIMAPEFVNAVHRTQTSHLPDPVDPEPIQQGISVYHTEMNYGGVSFAILADRMFKSAPRALLPDAEVWNGWPQSKTFDAATQSDRDQFVLLGDRQLAFLSRWAVEWKDQAWMKVVLSQTLFSNGATIPADQMSGASIPNLPLPAAGEIVTTDKFAADMDSDGWPQSGRNRALRIMRRARALHVVGDQHLGSVVQYGIENWNDAGYAFVVPSIANIWPRRWFPPIEGANRKPGSSWYTGEFLDGFGNKMTVLAAANPQYSDRSPAALYDRVPGYGIVRMRRDSRDVTFEAWPRWVDPSEEGATMYHDWPVTFNQLDLDGRSPVGYLPLVRVSDRESLVTVHDESANEHLYTYRLPGTEFRPPVFKKDVSYRVTVESFDGQRSEFNGVNISEDSTVVLGEH